MNKGVFMFYERTDHHVTGKTKIALLAFAMFVITFFLSSSLSSFIFYPTAPQLDSSVFRYVGMVMRNQGVPYKDTFDHKGPLIYVLNYLGQLMGKNGIWYIEFIGLYFSVFLTYKVLRLFCNSVPSIIGSCLIMFQLYDYLGGGNYTEEYALPFIICAIWIFTQYLLRGETSKYKLILCGACFMAVILLRANMIATWVVYAVAVLIVEVKKGSKQWIAYFFYFVSGALIAFFPFLVYFGFHRALKDFWTDYVIFNLSYTGTNIVGKGQAIRHFLWSAPCFFAAVASGIRALESREDSTLDFINLFYIAVSVWMIGMGGRTYNHYGIILIPLTILPVARILQYICLQGSSRRILIGAIVAVIILGWPWWNGLTTKYLATPADQTLEGILASYIRDNTNDDDLIIQCGHKDIFYVLSGRMAASKYSYPLPIAQIDNHVYDEFFNDLQKNHPVVVITDTWTEQNQLDYTEMNIRLDAFLKDNAYVEGPAIDSYALYYEPNSKLAGSMLTRRNNE